MTYELYYPVATDRTLDNCNSILREFYKSGYPIIFKAKGTNYHIALVKEINRDIITVGNEYWSYAKFLNMLHDRKIKGVVVLIPALNNRAELVYDKKLRIGLDVVTVDDKATAKCDFLQDQTGNILLYSKIERYFEDDGFKIHFL